MMDTFFRANKAPKPPAPEQPEWIKDDQDRRLLRWLAIKDFFRYGCGGTFAMLASHRERKALTERRKRDRALDKAIREYDDYLWERGSGITSSG